MVRNQRVERRQSLWNRSVESCRPAVSISVTGEEAATLRDSAFPSIALGKSIDPSNYYYH